jgi:hypothetical protein
VFGIAERLPFQEQLIAVRHIRDQIKQHDGFVEVIEIVGRKTCARIDVGGNQVRSRRALCFTGAARVVAIVLRRLKGRHAHKFALLVFWVKTA